jgi:hypothetical protein
VLLIFRINEPSHPSCATTSVASLDSLKKPYNADDIVWALDRSLHEKNDKTLGRHIFEDRPLYLYQLAILAATLNENEEGYKLFSKNCYWFAGSLIGVLESQYHQKMEGGDGKEQGKGKEKGEQGTWQWIQVYRTSTTLERDIIAAYNTSVGAFEETVSAGCVVL